MIYLLWVGARLQQVRRGGISSELLMCGGGVRSILFLPPVNGCLETIDVCIWRIFLYVCCSNCVGGMWEVCCVAAVVENKCFCLELLKLYLCKGCDGCCVFCLYCDAWSCR